VVEVSSDHIPYGRGDPKKSPLEITHPLGGQKSTSKTGGSWLLPLTTTHRLGPVLSLLALRRAREPNLAARLQALAEPNTVVIADSAWWRTPSAPARSKS
jgi:hypothetical protein